MSNYTAKDTNPVPWSEVEEMLAQLHQQVTSYFNAKSARVDVITPLHRTGGIVGGLLGIRMKVEPILPVQFKYSYHPTAINQISTIPDLLVALPAHPNILMCEGNTSTGSVAKKAAAAIHEKYPQAKLYLATLTKVLGCPDRLEGIEEVFFGRMTDENLKATDEEKKQFNLRSGITIFPWEKMEDELADINAL